MLTGYKNILYLPIRNWFAAITFTSPRLSLTSFLMHTFKEGLETFFFQLTDHKLNVSVAGSLAFIHAVC